MEYGETLYRSNQKRSHVIVGAIVLTYDKQKYIGISVAMNQKPFPILVNTKICSIFHRLGNILMVKLDPQRPTLTSVTCYSIGGIKIMEPEVTTLPPLFGWSQNGNFHANLLLSNHPTLKPLEASIETIVWTGFAILATIHVLW